MAYSKALADRIRRQLVGVKRVTEQEMFGGLSFLVAGHMCCGASGDDLVVHVPPELHHDALVRPHVREMQMGGRSMRSMVLVDPEGLADDGDLQLWVRLGLARASSLPPKPAKRVAKKPAKRLAKRGAKPIATGATKPLARKSAEPAKGPATKKAATKKAATKRGATKASKKAIKKAVISPKAKRAR